MEIKNGYSIKADVEGRMIRGYASKFGNVDSHRDIILPGAFVDSIAEKFNPDKNQFGIKVFLNHEHAIGIPLVLHEDKHGLFVEGRISNTPKGDEAIELIKDHVIDQMSIGFNVVIEEWIEPQNSTQGEDRLLHKLDLWEVSAVVWGSNSDTAVAMKSERKALWTALELEAKDEGLEIAKLTQKQINHIASILDTRKSKLDNLLQFIKQG